MHNPGPRIPDLLTQFKHFSLQTQNSLSTVSFTDNRLVWLTYLKLKKLEIRAFMYIYRAVTDFCHFPPVLAKALLNLQRHSQKARCMVTCRRKTLYQASSQVSLHFSKNEILGITEDCMFYFCLKNRHSCVGNLLCCY